MHSTLESLSAELELTDQATFVGDVDDAELPGWYQRADVFVLPANARAEAFGTVLLEAMASGLPCITTELGTGTSWIVQDGVTGLVVLPEDPGALAQAIERMKDASRRQQMREAGRARVEALFTQERMINQVMQVYKDALSN
jgi:rhamnosyl/mannosyltransferase